METEGPNIMLLTRLKLAQPGCRPSAASRQRGKGLKDTDEPSRHT